MDMVKGLESKSFEGAGVVQSGEKEAQRLRPSCSLQISERRP